MISHPFSHVDVEMLKTVMSYQVFGHKRIKSKESFAFIPYQPTLMSPPMSPMSPLVAETSLLLIERQSSLKNTQTSALIAVNGPS